MTSAWGESWGAAWGNSWGVTVVTKTGGDVIPLWARHHLAPPIGTQPAIVVGRDITLWTEFEPGTANGTARAKASRLRRGLRLENGIVSGSARAALTIHAQATGAEISANLEVSAGVFRCSASTISENISHRISLKSREQNASAIASGNDAVIAALLHAGTVKANAVAASNEITIAALLHIGMTKGSAAAVGREKSLRSLLTPGHAAGTKMANVNLVNDDLLLLD